MIVRILCVAGMVILVLGFTRWEDGLPGSIAQGIRSGRFSRNAGIRGHTGGSSKFGVVLAASQQIAQREYHTEHHHEQRKQSDEVLAFQDQVTSGSFLSVTHSFPRLFSRPKRFDPLIDDVNGQRKNDGCIFLDADFR